MTRLQTALSNLAGDLKAALHIDDPAKHDTSIAYIRESRKTMRETLEKVSRQLDHLVNDLQEWD